MRDFLIIVIEILSIFVILFPLIMAFLWTIGGVIHYCKNKRVDDEKINNLKEKKFIIMVPIYNEGAAVREHIERLLELDYKDYEVWAIDDGSKDESYTEISKISNSKLKIHQNKENLGKANTLNNYVDKVDSEYFLVIDSDTKVEKNILKILNYETEEDKKRDNNKYVGYTGNITVYSECKDRHDLKKNKIKKCETRNLIIQKIEYRTFIDMIKRSQSLLFGSIMTLSGACSCYKTDVVQEIGKFNTKNTTEDIEISWRLNQEGYKLKYLSNVQAKVLTPENVYDLIEQRKRWTIGMLQTVFQNFGRLFTLKNNRLKFFVLESFLSAMWAISFFVVTLFYIFVLLTKQFVNVKLINFLPSTILILIFSILLATVAYYIAQEREKLKTFLRYYFWFPFIYFVIQPIAFVKGMKSFLFKKQDGKWRGKSKENSKYLFATIVDIFATFIFINVLRHIISDRYLILHQYPLKSQIILFFLIKVVYIMHYFNFIRLGERTVGRKYSLIYNISLWILIISTIDDMLRIVKYTEGTMETTRYFIINSTKVGLYIIGVIILYNVFKNIATKKK